MSDYWAERAAEQARKQYDKSLADLEKENYHAIIESL